MADEEQVDVQFLPRTLRVQRNGRDALTILVDGVEVRLMADGGDPKARALLADLYSAPRGVLVYTRRKR